MCEELLDELCSLLGAERAGDVTVIDIEGDPALERKYGTRIPVVTADDDFVCAYRLDAGRVRAYLS